MPLSITKQKRWILLTLVLVMFIPVLIWISNIKKINQSPAKDVYSQLSPEEQATWNQLKDGLINIAKQGGGEGPAIGQIVDLSNTLTLKGTTLDVSNGIYAIMSGFTECGVCQYILEKFPAWEKDLGIQTVFIGTGDFNKIHPDVDVISKGVTQVSSDKASDESALDAIIETKMGLDVLGFYNPGFVILDNGKVIFKALGNAAQRRYDIDAVIKNYLLDKKLPVDAHLIYNQRPSKSIDIILTNGSKATLPNDFGETIDVVYVLDPKCSMCDVAAPGIIEALLALANNDTQPLSIWLVGYDNVNTKDVLSSYVSKYPTLKAGIVQGVTSDSEGTHPLQAWSRVLIPDTLVFKKGELRAIIRSFSVTWGSLPRIQDLSPYLEATKQIVTTLANSD